MGKDRILILGAGNAQIDAIEYCKNHNFEVVGCSYTAVDNGIPHLDYFEQVDIKDVEGVISIAEKYKVKLIYSVGSDVAMPTVMSASKKLGLPYFIEPNAASTCQSKVKMRARLGEDFEGNVEYIECSDIEDAKKYTAFPGMMKPSDSQGQRGCFRVDSFEDIRKEFQTSMDFSKEGKVIIESFLEGKEISVNAFFVEGEMKYALVSDRVSFDEYPGGIIKEHLVPSKSNERLRENIIRVAKAAASRLDINDGPCYFQIKLDINDNPRILEVTPRLDGCHMWNLIKHYCGVDLLAASFDLLQKRDPIFEINSVSEEVKYKLEFFCQPPWTIFDSSAYSIEDAEYYFFYYKDGDKVRRLNGYIEKCGYKIVKLN